MADYSSTLEHYKKLLTFIKSAVTRNYSEKSINNLLEKVSNCQDMKFLEEFYNLTLATLEDAKNEVLWVGREWMIAFMDSNSFAIG